MPVRIDFATLDLMDALDLAVLIEVEAHERYKMFAAQLGHRFTGDAASVFTSMAENEAKHGKELADRRKALFGDAPMRVSRDDIFDVEAPDVGAPRSKMSPLQAFEVALSSEQKAFDFYDQRHPIYTRPRFLPSSRADGCDLAHTVLAEGCLIQDADIRQSVIGLRSIIGPDVRMARTVMMGADFYETPERRAENRNLDRPDVGIGRGCIIEGAIIDKNARIGEGVAIRAHAPDEDMVEGENYVIRDGIVVIPKNAVIPDGTII